MPNRSENIAAQALKAMRLRRQLESGEITQQQYLVRLEALETTVSTPPATAPPVVVEMARGRLVADPNKRGAEPLPKVVSAARKTDNGGPAPLKQSPEIYRESEKKAEPVQWRLVPSRTRPELERVPARTAPPQRKQEPGLDRADAEKPERRMPSASTVLGAMQVASAPVGTQRPSAISATPKSKTAGADPIPVRQSPPRSQRLRWLLAAAGGIVVTAGVLQVRGFTGVSRKASTVQEAAITAPAVLQPELTLAQAGFVGPAQRRRIEGVLENMSGKAYTDVEVTFGLIGPNGDTMGLATATIDRIGSHQTARFQTADVKPAAHLILKRIDTRAD